MISKPNVLTDQCRAAVSEIRPPQLAASFAVVSFWHGAADHILIVKVANAAKRANWDVLLRPPGAKMTQLRHKLD
jgi:hypothetical protein